MLELTGVEPKLMTGSCCGDGGGSSRRRLRSCGGGCGCCGFGDGDGGECGCGGKCDGKGGSDGGSGCTGSGSVSSTAEAPYGVRELDRSVLANHHLL
jgi:hypothetical protein